MYIYILIQIYIYMTLLDINGNDLDQHHEVQLGFATPNGIPMDPETACRLTSKHPSFGGEMF